jgi:ABC-type nickel/cobalt efflux system permease component RcnA
MQWILDVSWPDGVAMGAAPLRVQYEGNFAHVAQLFSMVTVAPPSAPLVLVTSSAPTPREAPMPPDFFSAPDDLATNVVRVTDAEFVLHRAASVPADVAGKSNAVPGQAVWNEVPGGVSGRLTAAEAGLRNRVMDLMRPPLRRSVWGLFLLLCLLWGALHALSPGHGKAIVSSYLIAQDARWRHIALVGGVVTLAHTSVVLVLAVAAVLLEDRFVFPRWLQPAGAILILLVGLNQVRRGVLNLAGHASSHSHGGHHHGILPACAPRSTWELVAVGLSGGMAPCPSAIVLLLFSLQIGRPALGLGGLAAFSLGLAGALIVVGRVALAGTRLALRAGGKGSESLYRAQLAGWAPLAGGLVLLLLGFLLLL